ncbi:MFS transporter [Ramlibacter sp. MAHUQ-53]|uniref:MFS transporter n=1 Tax=unclassified Ramlibacter TaxID=2617605 RepID=UPI0036347D02
MHNKPTTLLLNIGHALDHMFLLIFATAVTSIARDFGVARWEDLMPYSVAAFFFFGLGSLPAGRLGDLWGRRQMMIVFFVGIGLASILVALTTTPLQLAVALAVLGCAASIYHPVGIPMLVQGAARPGWTIGVNGLAGNLGLALAAAVTGLFIKYWGWRMAFVIPGVASILCGLAFAACAPREAMAPARKKAAAGAHPGLSIARLLMVMTIAATSGSMLFNFSTSSNYELLADKFAQVSQDPARIGLFLAAVYVLASLTQLLVGHLLDKVALKTLYRSVIVVQLVALLLANATHGWAFYFAQLLFMAAIFGAVPFTDAMVVRYVDDAMRSRVSGMRLAVALGASSLAVWLIGPIVKAAGFSTLIWVMAGTSCITLAVVSLLPGTPVPPGTAAAPGEAR